jgi:hypothetical protein
MRICGPPDKVADREQWETAMEPLRENWAKLNPRERMAATGALVVVAAWIVGLVGRFGIGTGSIPLLAAVAVLVIYYLQYSPSQEINWPAPVPTLVLGISAVAALLAIVSAIEWLGIMGVLGGFFAASILSVIATAVGAGLMAYGAWQEYQATKQAV